MLPVDAGVAVMLSMAAGLAPGQSAPRAAAFDTVTLAGREVPVRARAGGTVVTHLTARTAYGTRARLWVRARRNGWLKVSAEGAPGGAGWISRRHTRPAAPLSRRIVIDRSARRLTVIGPGGRWSTPVIVGGASSPTPLGTFQVTDSLDGRRFSGVYGAWILVLSSFGSSARTSRLAVHGRPPVARSATESAGCVRVPAAALRRLVREVAAGTPVRIRA